MIPDDENTKNAVSIPMTVLGGLQFDHETAVTRGAGSFNTDDGIRRAAI